MFYLFSFIKLGFTGERRYRKIKVFFKISKLQGGNEIKFT